MIDLIKYTLQDFFRSQKYFPPISTFIIVIFVFYTYTPNPVVDSYAVTALVVYVISAWISVSMLALDPPIQRQLMILHIGSSYRYYLAKIISIWLISILLAIYAFVYPIIFNMFNESVTFTVGFMSILNHILLATLGIMLASLFSKGVMESTVNSYGGLALALILSIAAIGIQKLLPAPLENMVWLLPPALMTHVSLLDWTGESISQLELIPFLWIFLYSLILLVTFLSLSKQKA